MTSSSNVAKVRKLSSGRPPASKNNGRASFSAKAARSIIRRHHQLNKALRDAGQAGDSISEARLQAEMDKGGGLKVYQEASLLGQSRDRGGDSSKVLVEWLKRRLTSDETSLEVLEVGALSTHNACSRWKRMNVTRIDLNAQEDGITQQDFMRRDLAKDESERFDVVSLSLVLNYVPSKEGRGDMLKRVAAFLRQDRDPDHNDLPCVFIVLPAPCLTNSRYLDQARFEQIMRHLGYSRVESRETSKLVYLLFVHDRPAVEAVNPFPKTEIRTGRTRNNFSIVL